MKTLKKVWVSSLVVAALSAGWVQSSYASSEAEMAEFFSLSRFVDENARLNIQHAYLPNIQAAYAISKSTVLSHQQKQERLYVVLKKARVSLEAQREDSAFMFVGHLVSYKLNQFQSAIAAGDFERTASMAKSAKELVHTLTE